MLCSLSFLLHFCSASIDPPEAPVQWEPSVSDASIGLKWDHKKNPRDLSGKYSIVFLAVPFLSLPFLSFCLCILFALDSSFPVSFFVSASVLITSCSSSFSVFHTFSSSFCPSCSSFHFLCVISSFLFMSRQR